MPRKRPEKPAAAKPNRAPEHKPGQHPNSRANLARGGGKKGRSGAKPKSFLVYCEQLLEEAAVRETMYDVLTDPENRNFPGTLKAVAAYAHGLPKATLAVQNTTAFVVLAPGRPGGAEEWLQQFAPAAVKAMLAGAGAALPDGQAIAPAGPVAAVAPGELLDDDAEA